MTIQGKKITIYPNEYKDVVSKGIKILDKGHNELKAKVNKNVFDPIKDALKAIIIRGIKQNKLIHPTKDNFAEINKNAKELFGDSFFKTITNYTTKYEIKLDDWLKGIESVLNDLIAKPLLLENKKTKTKAIDNKSTETKAIDNKSTETKAIDNKSTETKAIENKTETKSSYDINDPRHKYLTDFENKFKNIDTARNLFKTNKAGFDKAIKESLDYAEKNNIRLTGMNKVQDPIIQRTYTLYSEIMNLS